MLYTSKPIKPHSGRPPELYIGRPSIHRDVFIEVIKVIEDLIEDLIEDVVEGLIENLKKDLEAW